MNGRDFALVTERELDVLVIGGGINGAAIAWDAALRGLSVALVERFDFGGQTSSGCFKIVHGGMRYLQHLDFQRLMESVQEQRWLRSAAPHLVHPLPFLVPCYGKGMQSRLLMELGASVYDALTCLKNLRTDDAHRLPAHHSLTADRCLRIAPGIAKSGLSGGVVFYDCQMSNCERLTYAVVRSAAEAGALVLNYAEVTSLGSAAGGNGARLTFASVTDLHSGKRHEVRARCFVNAAGPWVHDVLARVEKKEGGERDEKKRRAQRYSKGIQLVLPQLVSQYALAVQGKYRDGASVVGRGGRSFFLHPWRGYSLLGTTDTLFEGHPDDYRILSEEVVEFLSDFRDVYHSPLCFPDQVRYAFGGLRPISRDYEEELEGASPGNGQGDVKAARKDEIIDHANANGREPIENLLSVIGVKYTTFRSLAERVVDSVSRKVGGKERKCATGSSKLWCAPPTTLSELEKELHGLFPKVAAASIGHLVRNYGTAAQAVLELTRERPELGAPLNGQNETLAAELLYVAFRETPVTLEDAVFRRTGLGALGFPGQQTVRRASLLIGEALGWDATRCEEERLRVEEVFSSLYYSAPAASRSEALKKRSGSGA